MTSSVVANSMTQCVTPPLFPFRPCASPSLWRSWRSRADRGAARAAAVSFIHRLDIDVQVRFTLPSRRGAFRIQGFKETSNNVLTNVGDNARLHPDPA